MTPALLRLLLLLLLLLLLRVRPAELLLEIDLSRIRITSGEPSAGSYFEALQSLEDPCISLRALVAPGNSQNTSNRRGVQKASNLKS